MTRELCLLCARTRTRRWVRKHWVAVPGGAVLTGAGTVALTWHDFTAVAQVIWYSGLVVALAGIGGLLAWIGEWKPPRHPARALRRWIRRNCEWYLAAAAFLVTDAAASLLVIVFAGGLHT